MIVTELPETTLEFTGHAPVYNGAFTALGAGLFRVVAGTPSYTWAVPVDRIYSARKIYTMTLTGDADGLPDVEIPIASFQSRIRQGAYSYLSCVVPASIDHADAITSRPSGQVVIRMGYAWPDGTRQLEEIVRANFDNLQIDRGARSDSATIVGYRYTALNNSPRVRHAEGMSHFALMADGRRRVRYPIDLFMRPGDICVYGSASHERFTVGTVTHIVAARPPRADMEVSEDG